MNDDTFLKSLFKKPVVVALFAIVIILMILLAAFISQYPVGEGGALAGMGQRGDFFGGFLNPILSFLAFSGVVYTIYLQQRDMAGAREDARKQSEMLDKQNFESTFFQMLNLQNNLVSSMDFRNRHNGDELRGRDCFKAFRSHMRDIFASNQKGSQDEHFMMSDDRNIIKSYMGMYASHQQDLGHYFRYLYNVVRYVDECEIPSVARTEFESRMRYIRLLRAQLSDFELVILMYNSLTDQGFEFKKYIERYALLDNLSDEIILSPSHRAFFKPTAFDSRLLFENNAVNLQGEIGSAN